MKHKILSAVLILGLTSCMKLKKKNEDLNVDRSSKSVVQSQTADQNPELTYKYVTKPSSAITEVEFTTPSNWPEQVFLKKINPVMKSVAEDQIQFDLQGHWSDLITSEVKITYQFYSKFGTQLILLDEVEVLPVLNLDLKEDLNLAEKYQLSSKTKAIFIKNLNLNQNTHLYLNDFSGEVVIQNLDSIDGTIQSFADDQYAENGVQGRSGGVIHLLVLNGLGNLNVVMKGENGGMGLPAKLPDEALKGLAGTPGTPATFEFYSSTEPWSLQYANCVTPPGKGDDGDRGLRGYPGNDGKNGGDSGIALVENKSSELKINLINLAGKKGIASQGGDGGEGGDAGIGGDGAENDLKLFSLNKFNAESKAMVQKRCAPAANGEKGGYGSQGKSGQDGLEGTKQKSCFVDAGAILSCNN